MNERCASPSVSRDRLQPRQAGPQSKQVQRVNWHRHTSGIKTAEQRGDIIESRRLDDQHPVATLALFRQGNRDPPSSLVQIRVADRFALPVAGRQKRERYLIRIPLGTPPHDVDKVPQPATRRLVGNRLEGRVDRTHDYQGEPKKRLMLLSHTIPKSVEPITRPSRCNGNQDENGDSTLGLMIVPNSRFFARLHRRSVRTPIGGASEREKMGEQAAGKRPPRRVAAWGTVLLLFAVSQQGVSSAHGQTPSSATADNSQPRVTQISLGTPLDLALNEGWTDVVLIAHPRVLPDDADQIGELVKKNAELLSFVLLARVQRPATTKTSASAAAAQLAPPASVPAMNAEATPAAADQPGDQTEPITEIAGVADSDTQASPDQATAASAPALPPAVLADIGVGLAMKVGGRWQIVTGPIASNPDSYAARRPAPGLGFISSQVLRTAARSLDDMKIVVRRTTLIIHDSPAVLKLGDQNISGMIRSMIWVDSKTGKLHHILWTLQRGIMEP
jgi:hypothetical protein